MDDRVVGPLGALPAAVAVHGVVAPGDRSHAADADAGHRPLQLTEEAEPAIGSGVTAIGEGVHDHAIRR